MRKASSTSCSSSVAAIAQPTTKRENRSRITARYSQPSAVSTALVVHPPSSGHFWKLGNPELPARLMSPTSTPHRGMFIRVPVSRRPLHRLFDLSPGLEASSFERQRLEGFPPGFNQVQVGIVNLFIGAK